VPFAINNSGNMSVNAAELLYTNLREAERTGTVEAEIIVLEIGVGLGLFARYFLDAFRDMCKRQGKDYYGRLHFIAADRSGRMLVDACRHGVFSNHAGRYLLRVLDALEPGHALATDLAVTTQRGRPIRAIFLNYLLDCLPAAVLELD